MSSMRLDPQLPVYVFDTSALIEFALARSAGHAALLPLLNAAGQYLYHPITLAELTDYFHESLIAARRPTWSARRVREHASLRRRLVALLCAHRKRDDPLLRLHGRRFLPCATPYEWFSHLADQRSRPQHLRRMSSGEATVVAPLTDHQVLALATWLRRCRYSVTFVSGDQEQLAAAAYLSLSWLYSHNPTQTIPFTWTPL
jgi:hypothetical protein